MKKILISLPLFLIPLFSIAQSNLDSICKRTIEVTILFIAQEDHAIAIYEDCLKTITDSRDNTVEVIDKGYEKFNFSNCSEKLIDDLKNIDRSLLEYIVYAKALDKAKIEDTTIWHNVSTNLSSGTDERLPKIKAEALHLNCLNIIESLKKISSEDLTQEQKALLYVERMDDWVDFVFNTFKE